LELDEFHTAENGSVSFTREHASRFAKSIAGDFNPIHDVDARRFCVPGDLLFALYLQREGVTQEMTFEFVNMVDDGTALTVVRDAQKASMVDASGKEYLSVISAGGAINNDRFAAALMEGYVRFSGQTFPYLLVDLMRRNELMINPARPLVFYRRMRLNIEASDVQSVSLEFTGSTMDPVGKKADVCLNFDILSGGKRVGYGSKEMVVGGLQVFESDVIDELVEKYQSVKAAYIDGVPG